MRKRRIKIVVELDIESDEDPRDAIRATAKAGDLVNIPERFEVAMQHWNITTPYAGEPGQDWDEANPSHELTAHETYVVRYKVYGDITSREHARAEVDAGRAHEVDREFYDSCHWDWEEEE